eukprot:TRINITY_DN22891_c0_g1_i1.p1 TRINITY_DN22891_c0_g1~~TRINITY_DN22891_c0_g1_i1.p1  ORF type:complete len:736 (+),score=99.75 TRINITY_DN22891_c0_g1_i1:158-2209(+)
MVGADDLAESPDTGQMAQRGKDAETFQEDDLDAGENLTLSKLDRWMTRQEASIEALKLIHQRSISQLSDQIEQWMSKQEQAMEHLGKREGSPRMAGCDQALPSTAMQTQVKREGSPRASRINQALPATAMQTQESNRSGILKDVHIFDRPYSSERSGGFRDRPFGSERSMGAISLSRLYRGESRETHSATERQRSKTSEFSNDVGRDMHLSTGSNMRRCGATLEKVVSAPDPTPQTCRQKLKRFVQSNRFDHLVAVLLMSNAIFIGVQVEYMFGETTPSAIKAIDYLYSFVFIFELGIRIFAFGVWTFATDYENLGWNWFDLIVVGFSTADTLVELTMQGKDTPLKNISVLRVVRIVRITRVLRIIRVMRFFKHLRMLIAAISTTLRTAMWTILMLFMILYIFGIGVAQTSAEFLAQNNVPDDDPLRRYFGSLPMTIMTLFMSVCGGIDWETAWFPLYQMSPATSALFCFFIVFVTLVVLNVMTGIFCESAIDAAQSDKEHVIACQLQNAERYAAELQDLFQSWDTSGDGNITAEEFEAQLEDKRVVALFQSLDIDAADASEFFSLLDRNGGGCVDCQEFIEGCIRLRGGAKAVQMAKLDSDGRWLREKVAQLEQDVKALPEKRASVMSGTIDVVCTDGPTEVDVQTSLRARPPMRCDPPQPPAQDALPPLPSVVDHQSSELA